MLVRGWPISRCNGSRTRPWRYDQCDCGAQKRKEAGRCANCARGKIAANPEAESFVGDANTATVTRLTDRRIKTLKELISVCEVDTSEWTVDRYVVNKWEVGAKDSDGKIAVEPLFQVKAWLKRKVAVIDAKAELASLLASSKASFKPRPFPAIKASSGIMLEPAIPDLHVGKLCWGQETGWDNYDTSSAEKVFDAALDALVTRCRGYGADRVVFPVGNDLLHCDSKHGTTTAGTNMDCDSRYQKTFQVARHLITRAVDRLRQEVGPVHVVMVPGNHDTMSVWHLGDSLECLYHNAKGITIDNAPTQRKYHRHGQVMLMFTHGNCGKLQDYPLLMASEQPVMFGQTLYREAHTGDKHHTRVQEFHGIKVRISPALCPPDAWHSENHFVGALRAAEAFVWDQNEGLIGTAHYTVPATTRAR